MSFAFDRPVGAAADATELDYVAALHQTDVRGGIRKDGSIQDVDISLFLSSRYGVQVTPEEVRKLILSGLGSFDECMDMMQLVSLLLIPILRQEQEDRTEPNPSKSTEDVMLYTVEMLLHDVTGSRQPKPLTSTLIKQIFQAYGEEALSGNEELVQSMLEQAGAVAGERVMLDAQTFCKALTADLQDYNIDNKDKLSTNYDDVMAGYDGIHDLSLKDTIVRNMSLQSDRIDQQRNTMQQADSTSVNRKESTKDSTGDEVNDVEKEDPREENGITEIYTAPQVDNVADTFRSRPLVLFQWAFFVLSFQTYLIRVFNKEMLKFECKAQYNSGSTWFKNAGAFFCTIALQVFRWFIVMLAMSAIGVLYFLIGGIGNDIECVNPLYPLGGMAIAALCTLLPPFLFRAAFIHDGDTAQQFLEIVTLVLGCCAALLTLWHSITLLPKASWVFQWCKCVLIPEAIRTEACLKKASAYKLDTMVSNALEVHRVKKQESVVPTHFGQALLNFSETSPSFERVGGFCWTLRAIFNRNLFRQEGIRFSGRLVSTNFIQLIITVFILISGITLTYRAGETFDATWGQLEDIIGPIVSTNVDEAIASTIVDSTSSEFISFLNIVADPSCPDNPNDAPNCNVVDDVSECIPSNSNALCTLLEYSEGEDVNATVQKELLGVAGLDTVAVTEAATDGLVQAVEGTFNVFFPTERYMIVAPMAIGVGVAVLASFYITIMVIPSASATTLKFRSGVLPFVNDPRVRMLRIAPDQTAFLRGVMYWGCLFASALLGGVVAFIVFLYLWQLTALSAQIFTANIIGALVVIGLHVAINRSIRKVASSGFYRKKPAMANVTLLIRECGLVALTQGFAIFRILRLLFTTFLYAGRLDKPFLHASCGKICGFRIDGEPYMFQIDILQHEAHRHPFIETLGVMYLSKLRYRDTFCTFAGSSWRLIFVYVLMPWLSKYRAMRRPRFAEPMSDAEGGVPPMAPPLRAVTLMDPQAYALRAVSLVPVASGWAGGSQSTFGGRRLSVMSDGGKLSLMQDNVEDELRELREENENLRMQLRIKELSPATAVLHRDARSPRPHAASREIRRGAPQKSYLDAKCTHSTGVEVDSRGRHISTGQKQAPSALRKGGRLTGIDEGTSPQRPGGIDEDTSPQRPGSTDKGILPQRPGLTREGSAGLGTLRPPQPRESKKDKAPQVLWANYSDYA